MTGLRAHHAVAALAVGVLLVLPSVHAGFVTGIGAKRTVHLTDAANGLNATVVVSETFDGFKDNTYNFTLGGTASTAARAYTVEIAVSPDDPDTRAAWNASGPGPAGASNTTIAVTVPHDTVKGTLANAPFRVRLIAADGSTLDFADFSVDLRYREPPPDGGLFQLALASGFFWGLVFLYALYLQLAQRKLRARATALERSISGPKEEVRADGEKR